MVNQNQQRQEDYYFFAGMASSTRNFFDGQ
jgi:hypothetical protein